MGTQRVLFTGSYYPPVSGGSAMTLARLVEQFPPDQTAVVCEHPSNFAGVHNALVPPCAVHEQVRAFPALLGRLITVSMRYRARQNLYGKAISVLRSVIQRFQPTHIVAIYPNAVMLEATRAVAESRRIPWLPYFFDNPKEGELSSLIKEGNMLALTEGVQVLLRAQGGFDVRLVPHVALPAKDLPTKEVARQEISKRIGVDLNSSPLIVHTGAVEVLQIEGLTELVNSVRNWLGESPKIVLSTPSPDEAIYALKELGDPKFLKVVNLVPQDVTLLQRAADVLFATVPMRGWAVEPGKTCFPTKILDYLTVGTPILALGPKDSTLCRHAQEGGYAVTVNEWGPFALRSAIENIIKDSDLQTRLLKRAETTLLGFEGKTVARKLLNALDTMQTSNI